MDGSLSSLPDAPFTTKTSGNDRRIGDINPMSHVPMTSSSASDSADQLRARLRRDGFLFFPGLLPTSKVAKVRADLTAVLRAHDWLVADQPEDGLVPRHAGRHGVPGWWRMYERMQATERFHAFAHDATLTALVGKVFASPLLNHPRRQITMTSPRFWIPPHQEYLHIQGTADFLTAWTPLTAGPSLEVLADDGVRRLHPVARDARDGVGVTLAPHEDTWYHPVDHYREGDVVLIHSLAIRRNICNSNPEMRLSVEYRYQSAYEPVCKGSLCPQHYPRIANWRSLTKAWSTRKWVQTPVIKHVVDFRMGTSLDDWHTLLPKPASALVNV